VTTYLLVLVFAMALAGVFLSVALFGHLRAHERAAAAVREQRIAAMFRVQDPARYVTEEQLRDALAEARKNLDAHMAYLARGRGES
jgi:hypothetical protein